MSRDTKFFRMQPAEISVEVVTREGLKDLQKFIELHPDIFPAFDFSPAKQLKIVDNKLVVFDVIDKFFSEPPEPRLVAQEGTFYLTSNNGNRHFTSDARVQHGIMLSVPMELLIPAYGDPIDYFSI